MCVCVCGEEVVLRGPDDTAGRVGVGNAREHGIRAADVPVVVVALDGHSGRVWKNRRPIRISAMPGTRCTFQVSEQKAVTSGGCISHCERCVASQCFGRESHLEADSRRRR